MENNTPKSIQFDFLDSFSWFWKFESCLNPSYFKFWIHIWFKGGMYPPHEILTSTYRMELKLELVLESLIEGDDRWHQHFNHVSNMQCTDHKPLWDKVTWSSWRRHLSTSIGHEVYHVRKLSKRKGSSFSMYNLVSKLWVVLRNFNLIMRRYFIF